MTIGRRDTNHLTLRIPTAQIMATGGLLQWANGIRLTMATDPGRALFKEQVQMHGFSFLDDYLDGILLNVKQE